MKKNLHGNRYHAVAAGGAVDWDHPLNKNRVLWMLPGLHGTPAAGNRLLNLADPRGQTHGTLTNMVQGTSSGWQGINRPGGFGYLLFDGSNDYVDLGSGSSVSLGTGDFSFLAWFRSDSASVDGYLFSHQKATTAFNGLGVFVSGSGSSPANKISVEVSDGTLATIRSTATVNDGAWRRLAVTRTGATVNIYLNGLLDSTSSGGRSGDLTQSIVARLGSFTGNANFYKGGIDDVSLFLNRMLSASDVLADYNLSRQGYRTPDGPLRWISTRTYSVPAGAVTTLFRRSLTNRTGSRSAA